MDIVRELENIILFAKDNPGRGYTYGKKIKEVIKKIKGDGNDQTINGMYKAYELNDQVEYRHLDGTKCLYTHAKYVEEGVWFTIISEHNGDIKLHKEDVNYIKINGIEVYKNHEEEIYK